MLNNFLGIIFLGIRLFNTYKIHIIFPVENNYNIPYINDWVLNFVEIGREVIKITSLDVFNR